MSRSKGKSAVGASAYRSGEKLENKYDGMVHDYTKKQGVVFSEIMLPPQAKEEFKNREVLWNEVEKIENSKNSQLAREVEVSLPNEFNRNEHIELVKEYVQDNFIKNGMCADINIHDKGDGNPHAHIMLTMRPIEQNGEWGAKAKKEYLLDENGEKIKLKSGQYKSRKIDTTNWNSKEFLQSYREDWAKKINKKLKEKGINESVDHRSYKEQGFEKIPTKHEGYIARKIEKRGHVSDRIQMNREIKSINQKIDKVNNISARARKLNNIEKTIDKFDNRILELNDKRSKLGIFKIKEKKELDREIDGAIKSKSEAEIKLDLLFKSELDILDQEIEKINTEPNKAQNRVPKVEERRKSLIEVRERAMEKVQAHNKTQVEIDKNDVVAQMLSKDPAALKIYREDKAKGNFNINVEKNINLEVDR